MPNIRYKYNTVTCKYEPFYLSGRERWKQVRNFLLLSCTLSAVAYLLCVRYLETFDEMMMAETNTRLKISWNMLHRRIQKAQHHLGLLIEKDDHNYRVILDSEPLPASIREAGIGGSQKFDLNAVKDYSFIVGAYQAVSKLRNQAEVEMQSYNELQKILDDKISAWAARPAIQPISNDDLRRLHLTFGLREHPISKITREHKGLDFAADLGTPVYATGDAQVLMAYFSGSFGNVIYLDHGYGYESRYAHLSKFGVKQGERVKRGQLIGYVGDTGYSVSAHLHYEVLYKGHQVNPINFFQRDLSGDEYQKLIELGSENGISLD
jgi:hypothetical protein